MKEQHGIPDALKIAAILPDIQSVTVTDGDGGIVRLALGTASHAAGLTPEQARFVAKQLIASALRVTPEEPPR